MELAPTLVLTALALAAAAICGWRGARPPNPQKGPRLAPWRLMMVTSAAAALLLLVHAVNLLGVTTGR